MASASASIRLPPESANYDEVSMHQSLLFSESLKVVSCHDSLMYSTTHNHYLSVGLIPLLSSIKNSKFAKVNSWS